LVSLLPGKLQAVFLAINSQPIINRHFGADAWWLLLS